MMTQNIHSSQIHRHQKNAPKLVRFLLEEKS